MKTAIETVTVSQRVRTPSRDEEVAILREAIRQLGTLSYCGPWLADQLSEIERDMRNDFFPQIDRKATIRDCEHLLAVAQGNAREIEAAAGRVAKAKVEAAHADALAIRGRILAEIRKCQTTLGVSF